MIELNLLPDVKLEYIKAQRQRRLVVGISSIVTIAAVAVLVLTLGVSGLQKKHLSDLTKDINKKTATLQGTKNINDILTIQNQLQSLPALHNSKPAASRLFNYLNQVTPTNDSISAFNVDFTTQLASITGSGKSLTDVYKFIDTLKFTQFTTATDSTKKLAFTDVVLGTFGLAPTGGAQAQTSFTIGFKYDKALFDVTQEPKLIVPTLATTRAVAEQTTDLFQAADPTAANTANVTKPGTQATTPKKGTQ